MRLFYLIFIFLNVAFCETLHVDLKNNTLQNPTAYITSQCYTKTIDEADENIISNPCYTCHSKNKEPNYTYNDVDLQEAYDFPEPALKNPFTNLFKDRSRDIKKISDQEILLYVRKSNYKDKNGDIILAKKLKNLPYDWDANDNGKWDGYVPDCNYNFDDEGFDRGKNGSYTLWRAFAYYPFLGTFWPTNGSSDDVLIRLDRLFSYTKDKKFSKEVYKINLLIIEALIKQKNVKTFPIDEKKYGVDLNQDGKLNIAHEIVFWWKKPDFDAKTGKLINFSMSYVGLASQKLKQNHIHIAPGLYPKNTEFLHSVRYIDVDKNKNATIAPRMKELRYGKKVRWATYGDLEALGAEELKEKHDFPDRVDIYVGDIEKGLSNKRGWVFQGFIEDKKGDLRPQSYEETLYCMGCHSNIGAIADSTFAYQRKLTHGTFANGWFHWSQKGFKNIKDLILPSGEGEYAQYLALNNAGDEFRSNKEVMDKFFIPHWKSNKKAIQKELIFQLENPGEKATNSFKMKKSALKRLKNDISYLILPSPKRALKLNKAYKLIANEQSFIYGRDTSIKPSKNVHKSVKQSQSTGLSKYEY